MNSIIKLISVARLQLFGSRLVATQKSRLKLLDDSQVSISRPNFTAIDSSLLYYIIVVLVQQGVGRYMYKANLCES